MSTTTDKTQRMIFLALPFIFVTFVIQFPAGLLVYWITTNTWTIVQQAIIRKRLGPLRPPGADTGAGLAGLVGGGGGAAEVHRAVRARRRTSLSPRARRSSSRRRRVRRSRRGGLRVRHPHHRIRRR